MKNYLYFGILFFFNCVVFANASTPTPAERAIEKAQTGLSKSPNNAQAHANLAMALARRARETGDPVFYARAMRELDQATTIAPQDFLTLRTRVWVLLGQHEFAAAKTAAEALNRHAPDDLLTYAMLVDAYIELGDYAKAEQAAQWLLDIRPGNVAGLTRAAYLRELFGDLDGAAELMAQAVVSTPLIETEERAWILTHLAQLHLHRGDLALADRVLAEALNIFPNYHYAIAALAEVRLAQGDIAKSIELLRQHVALAPHPENRYELAKVLHASGATAAAQTEFDAFVSAARDESHNADNANRQLIHYLADHDESADALALAEREISRRRDVLTLDAYAWALHRNERSAEAFNIINEAIDVGTKAPAIMYHAGFIAAAVGELAAAQKHLSAVLDIAPWSPLADSARARLAETVSD